MYAYIKGKPVIKEIDSLIIDVNGIGYRIYTSQKTLHRISLDTSSITLYTHLHVRENDMTLYGFDSQEDLQVFKMLLNVSGIGPKVALSILSFLETSNFYTAILNQDIKTLSKVPGIGKKTASRLILELKEKINTLKPITEGLAQSATELTTPTSPEEETIAALQSLGYDDIEARNAVSQAVQKTNTHNIQELLRYSLKCLAKI